MIELFDQRQKARKEEAKDARNAIKTQMSRVLESIDSAKDPLIDLQSTISDKRMDKINSKEIRKVEQSQRAVKRALKAFNPHQEQVNLLILSELLSSKNIEHREQNRERIIQLCQENLLEVLKNLRKSKVLQNESRSKKKRKTNHKRHPVAKQNYKELFAGPKKQLAAALEDNN